MSKLEGPDLEALAVRWEAKAFSVIVGKHRAPASPYHAEVAGWVNGDWALDFRVYDGSIEGCAMPGWSLTHIPTGRLAGFIVADLATAQSIAAEMASAGDWSAVSGNGDVPKALKVAVNKVRERHDDTLLFQPATLGPLFWEARP